MSKISVIVPVYNVGKFLEECLDSIINQTFSDIEVLCIDDCSTDNSYSILTEYSKKDSRIKVFSMNKNSGLSVVRNLGIEKSLGKYISFIDSDDYLDLDFYSLLYKEANKYKAEISMSNIKMLDNKNLREFQTVSSEGCFSSFVEKFQDIRRGSVCDKLYLKSFLIEINLSFPVGKYYEDNFFTVKSIYLANKLTKVKKASYIYRKNQNSITTKLSIKKILDIIEARKNIKQFMKANFFSAEEKQLVLSFMKKSISNPIILIGKSIVKYNLFLYKKIYNRFT